MQVHFLQNNIDNNVVQQFNQFLSNAILVSKNNIVKLGQNMKLGPGKARILGPLVLGRSIPLK